MILNFDRVLATGLETPWLGRVFGVSIVTDLHKDELLAAVSFRETRPSLCSVFASPRLNRPHLD